MLDFIKRIIFKKRLNRIDSKREINEIKYVSKCCKDIINFIYHGNETYSLDEFYPLIKSNPHKIIGEKYCNNCGKECEIVSRYFL